MSAHHPSSVDLEAFACGDAVATVESHLGACDACRAFVEKLRVAAAAWLDASQVDDVMRAAQALAASSERIARGEAQVVRLEERKRRLDWRLAALPFVAAAAGVLLWWKLDATPDQPKPVAFVEPSSMIGQDPETTFKGGVTLAVVREREGAQERFTGQVNIRGGDRLRIEVALDRPRTILAGVLAEDGTWLDLMTEGTLTAGTHFSDQAARFDDDPMRGWILVGPEDAIAASRAAHSPQKGVVAMRLGWEGR
ncbi:MAG TPA: hypothetical protein VIF62_11890 [Labilithrix sp.]